MPLFSHTGIVALIIVGLSTMSSWHIPPPVFAQQSFSEGYPPTDFKKDNVLLYYRVFHKAGLISGQSGQSMNGTEIQLSLYNNDTQRYIGFVTYHLEVKDKNGNTTRLSDRFYSESGNLTLIAIYDPQATQTKVEAQRETNIDAWIAGLDGKLTLASPNISPEGDYIIRVEVVTADSIRNMLNSEDRPRIELSWSLDDIQGNIYSIPEFGTSISLLTVALSSSILLPRIMARIRKKL